MRHLEPLPAKMAHYLYAPVDPQHLAELDAIAFVGRGSRAPRSG
jgi:hypothetical protein